MRCGCLELPSSSLQELFLSHEKGGRDLKAICWPRYILLSWSRVEYTVAFLCVLAMGLGGGC